MSKYLTYTDIQFARLELLLAALRDIGYTQVEQGTNLKLNGYGNQRKTADVIIRKDVIGAWYGDVGFEKTPNGYVPVIDDIDVTHIHEGNFLPALRTAYGEQFASTLARNVHGTTHRKVQGNKIVITIRK